MEKLLDALKALSDETRLRILNLLYERALCLRHNGSIANIPGKSIKAFDLSEECRPCKRQKTRSVGLLFNVQR